MRAVIALQRNRNLDCIREIGKIIAYVWPRGKHILLALLACLPGTLPNHVYQWLKGLRNTHLTGGTTNGTT